MSKSPAAPDGAAHATSPLLDHVMVEVEAVLGSRRLTVGELRALVKDDVVALTASLSDPVELRVNGRTIAHGEIVAVDDSFAVRVTEVGA